MDAYYHACSFSLYDACIVSWMNVMHAWLWLMHLNCRQTSRNVGGVRTCHSLRSLSGQLYVQNDCVLFSNLRSRYNSLDLHCFRPAPELRHSSLSALGPTLSLQWRRSLDSYSILVRWLDRMFWDSHDRIVGTIQQLHAVHHGKLVRYFCL